MYRKILEISNGGFPCKEEGRGSCRLGLARFTQITSVLFEFFLKNVASIREFMYSMGWVKHKHTIRNRCSPSYHRCLSLGFLSPNQESSKALWIFQLDSDSVMRQEMKWTSKSRASQQLQLAPSLRVQRSGKGQKEKELLSLNRVLGQEFGCLHRTGVPPSIWRGENWRL